MKKVGYYFAPSGKPYPDNWLITDVLYEFDGTLLSRQVSWKQYELLFYALYFCANIKRYINDKETNPRLPPLVFAYEIFLIFRCSSFIRSGIPVSGNASEISGDGVVCNTYLKFQMLLNLSFNS